MTDLARLGFAVDTGDLKDAKASLDQLVPSATRAEAATDRFNRAAGGMGAAATKFTTAAQGAVAGADRLSKAALASGTAMGTVQRAAAGAAGPLNNLVGSVARVGTTFAQADAHVEAYRASLIKIPPAAQGATSSLARLGAAANDNINRLQSTPGNIAAQFQDIGVTAAAGMSPLIIALQQGTQLSSAMAGGVGNLFRGIGQLLTPTTLLTVAFVGLLAAGLQMINWISVGQSLLNGLADAMETTSVAAAYLGVVLLVAFAPQILSQVVALTASIGGALVSAITSATGAMIAFSIANPFTAIVLAIGLVVGAMYMLDDTFGGAFSNILGYAKSAANGIIGSFVAGFNTIKNTWKILPGAIGDYAYQAANATVNAVENMVNGVISRINGLTSNLPFGLNFTLGKVSFGGVDNPFSGMAQQVSQIAQREHDKAFKRDYVGDAAGAVKGFGKWAAGKLRGLAGGLGADDGKKTGGGKADGGASDVDKIAKSYDDLVRSIEAQIRGLQTESKAMDMSANAARMYRNEQDMLAKAMDKNIPITDAVKAKFHELAQQLTDAQIDVEFKKITKSADDQLRTLKDQGDLIGLSGLELEYNAERQKLLNQAVDAGVIDLNNMTDAMRKQVGVLSDRAMAIAQQTVANQHDDFIAKSTDDYNKQIVALRSQRGELGLTGAALIAYRYEQELLNDALAKHITLTPADIDLIHQEAVAYGESADALSKQREKLEFYKGTFKGFFSNMLDNLRQGQSAWQAFGNAVLSAVNKIVDRLLDMATNSLFNKLLGSLFKIAAPQASLAGSASNAIAENPGLFAHGGVFGVEKFAKGGAFTNGIFSSPKMFRFANGTALGQLGEAGPEAVMPLKRGPNGALGVEMHGPQTVRVIVDTNDDRFDAYVDDRSQQTVARSAPAVAAAGSNLARSNDAFLRRRRIGGGR